MKRILDKLDRYFHKWQFSVLDMEQGRWQVPARERNILYLKAMNAKGYHILMKPDDAMEKRFMLCDDVTGSLIEKDHRKNGTWKPGRLVWIDYRSECHEPGLPPEVGWVLFPLHFIVISLRFWFV